MLLLLCIVVLRTEADASRYAYSLSIKTCTVFETGNLELFMEKGTASVDNHLKPEAAPDQNIETKATIIYRSISNYIDGYRYL